MEKDVCLLLQDVSDEAAAELRALAPELEFIQVKRGDVLDDSVLRRVKVFYSHATAPFDAVLNLPDSRPDWLQLRSAGFDRLDPAAVRAKGMVVTNASGIHGTQMAETLFGILLGKARGLFDAARQQDAAVWNNRHRYEEITGRTMAIVGAGKVGRSIAAVARHGFAMPVFGVTRRGLPDDAFDRVYAIGDWRDAVAEADIVVNLLPLDDGTRRFFDAAAFEACKKGAWFINMGRGGTVDTDALLAALDAGRLGFAALDVFEKEPLPADSPLWARHDVFLTPHTGGLSVFYEDRAFALFKANLAAYVKTGKPAINVVDLP